MTNPVRSLSAFFIAVGCAGYLGYRIGAGTPPFEIKRSIFASENGVVLLKPGSAVHGGAKVGQWSGGDVLSRGGVKVGHWLG